jgi:uncharacterized membrane protein
MTFTEAFFYGIAGGLVPELIALYRMREDFHSNKPGWVNSFFYWIITAVMVLVGGLLALLYKNSGIELTPVLALHLGASAPILLNSLLAAAPKAIEAV